MKKKILPEKLNICIVAEKFPIFGRRAEYGFLWPIAKGLVHSGHSVTVLSGRNPLGKKSIEKDGVIAHFLGFDLDPGQNLAKKIYRHFSVLHKEHPFHLVHSVDANGIGIGLNKKKLDIALMYDVEATRMSQLFSILALSQESSWSMIKTGFRVVYAYLTTFFGRDRKLLKSADGVFVSSPQQRFALERHYYYPESRTFTIPYGIEVGSLAPREVSEDLRKKLNLPSHHTILVSTSDYADVQEMKNLFRAFEQIVIKKPSCHLIVLGDGPSFHQSEYEMLMLALGRKVTLIKGLGEYELADYISLADLFINLSSRSSGFDASVLEAMAQEKIVVGSEMTPLSTIIRDGVNGHLIRPADILHLTHLMELAVNGQLPTQTMGAEARKTALEIFDPAKMVLQTIDAYRKTLLNTGQYRRS